MTANATVVVEELADVLTIPTWVVRVDRATGETYVDRQAGDEPERVDVRLGVRYEGQVQVLDGLAEGDVVVLLPDEPGPFGGQ
jgi:multidrug efflux pump subunit AcrA (membrane-fusion protein)